LLIVSTLQNVWTPICVFIFIRIYPTRLNQKFILIFWLFWEKVFILLKMQVKLVYLFWVWILLIGTG